MTDTQPKKNAFELFPADPEHVDYLVNWSKLNKIIYTETPKVGCTVIKRILQYGELGFDSNKLPADVHEPLTSPLANISDDENEFYRAIRSDEYFKFSFVRNPLSRTLSAYLDKIIRQREDYLPRQQKLGIDLSEHTPTFDEFVDIIYAQHLSEMDVHWAPQTFLLGIENIRYDYLGRFEFFQASVEELIARTGHKIPPNTFKIGQTDATNATNLLARYYSKKSLKKVQDIFSDDFKYLGYGWSI